MTKLSKNINQYCKLSRISTRHFHAGSSKTIVDPQKMQAKTIVLSQWKFMNHLKNYLAKVSGDRMFENALNKEFAHFLQKIQPAIYGSDLIRYFGVLSNVAKTKSDTIIDSEAAITIPNILKGFKIKNGSEKASEKEPAIPKWKTNKSCISKDCVVSTTKHLIVLLTECESDVSRLEHVEELNKHLKQYPEAKHNAVKEGTIRLLIRIEQKTKNKEVQGAVKECLALLGHVNPVTNNGIRILSIDGGGTRGILAIEMLKKLEELSGKPIVEMFDFICGVSTGAIIASLIGIKQHSLNEVSEIYTNLSTQIFTQSPLKGTSNLVFSHSYYDTALWEKILKDQIGDKPLISTSRDPKCPKLCVISSVVNQSRLSAYIFRNYSFPYRVQSQFMGNHNHLVWEAVRASAAAPTYFEEFRLGNMLHQDGGVLINNPTAVAIHESKLLWPNTPIQCIVSFGTGRTVPTPLELSSTTNNSSWKDKFYAIIDSATDTEGVHTMLSDLLAPSIYYRFNPYLTEMLDIAEIDPDKLKQLRRDAVMYLRRNEDKFQEAVKALIVPKNIARKAKDWVVHMGKVGGIDLDFKFKNL